MCDLDYKFFFIMHAFSIAAALYLSECKKQMQKSAPKSSLENRSALLVKNQSSKIHPRGDDKSYT